MQRYVCFTKSAHMVVLLYPDISNFMNFTFQNVKILKYKIFLINFLDELGNFKQKIFTLQNVKFFYNLKQQTLYTSRIKYAFYFFRDLKKSKLSNAISVFTL